jgi:hypothetical protein
MRHSTIYIAFFLILNWIFTGCDPFADDGYREYVVVESYLVAERQLPAVNLSTTLPADQVYSFNDAAIVGADVMIHLLDEESDQIESSFAYSMIDSGTYIPQVSHTIRPRRSYLLEAEVEGYGLIRARTTVPDTFRVTGQVPESIVYQSSEQLEFTITPNSNPGRQNVYVFNTIAEEAEAENLTPFYKALIDNGDDNELRDFANNPSNLINEGNFRLNDDGSINLRFPWIGVAFYGTNRIVTNSLDSNIFDFIRSQDVQLGGSTLAPGEIPNAIYHVEGGIGVFGALSADTVVTNFVRPSGQ